MQEPRPAHDDPHRPRAGNFRAADALNPVSARPSAGPAAKPSYEAAPAGFGANPGTSLGAIFDAGASRGAAAWAGDGAADRRRGDARPEPALPWQGQADGCAVVSGLESRAISQKNGPDRIAGDVAISVETAIRQSVEQGHSLAAEIKVLMLHGLLHLAGHDHETDAGEMQRRERSLRARLGLPLGLIERTANSKRRATADPSIRSSAAADELAQDDRSKGQQEKMSGATSPTHSQKTRMDGAQRDRQDSAQRRDRQDGARGRKTTTGPSTSAAKTASAQDDKAKRGSRPKKKSARSVRS